MVFFLSILSKQGRDKHIINKIINCERVQKVGHSRAKNFKYKLNNQQKLSSNHQYNKKSTQINEHKLTLITSKLEC